MNFNFNFNSKRGNCDALQLEPPDIAPVVLQFSYYPEILLLKSPRKCQKISRFRICAPSAILYFTVSGFQSLSDRAKYQRIEKSTAE